MLTSHFAVIGYDNMEVNLEPVLDYIKAQNYKALEYEQNAKRVSGMNKWTVSFWLHLFDFQEALTIVICNIAGTSVAALAAISTLALDFCYACTLQLLNCQPLLCGM